MRVIFETPPVPAVSRIDSVGSTARGTVRFVATVYDFGEPVRLRGGHPEGEPLPLSSWRRGPGAPIRVIAPKSLVGLPEVVIPSSILDVLPEDARVLFQFRFSPGVGR